MWNINTVHLYSRYVKYFLPIDKLLFQQKNDLIEYLSGQMKAKHLLSRPFS